MILNRQLIFLGAGAGLALVVAAAWSARRVGAAVNPLNPENVFNQAAGAVVTQLTGREETLGGWLAEMIDPRARELARVLSAPPSVVATNPVHGGYL